jgi:DNA-binding transcriptional LysR family regulator
VYPQEIPSDIDLCISYGKPPVSEERVKRLEKAPLVPVGSAKLFGGNLQSKMAAEKLTNYTLIHADDGTEWRDWFRLTNVKNVKAERNLYLGTGYHNVLDCIRRGLGIGLMAKRFIEKDLASERLTVIHTETTFQPEYYYVTHPEEEYRSAAGRDFESWLYALWQQ